MIRVSSEVAHDRLIAKVNACLGREVVRTGWLDVIPPFPAVL